jgi:hypothetical protein
MNAGRAQATGSDQEAAQTTGSDPAQADSATETGQAAPGTVSKRTAAAILSRLRAPAASGPAQEEAAAPPPRRWGPPWLWHLILLGCFIGAGIGVTWPLTAKLTDGQLPWNGDVSSYVWALWWMAHQVSHLGNPFNTTYMAAPVGIQLGFDTLMPLPGLIMTPVTLLWGPTASFAVLTIITPGLLCYVTYRAARLWLGQPGSIAAGALFGLSTMVTWQNIFHLNISIGTIFLPLTLEACIRLRRTASRDGRPSDAAPSPTPRRNPGRRQGVVLGVILGASVLTNQESAVLAALLTIGVLLPWLIRLAIRPGLRQAGPQLGTLVLGAVVALVVASPQLAAMLGQAANGGLTIAKGLGVQLTQSYRNYGVGLGTLFSPSPRLGHFHLGQLTGAYEFTSKSQVLEGRPTFGVVLAGLAVVGLLLYWRRGHMWWLALLFAAGAALALGPTLILGSRTFIPLATRWHGVTVSQVMPYTWLIRIPGLSALREADRIALLGLLGAAILAGAAIQWLCQHLRPVLAGLAVAVLAAGAFLEAGWSGTGPTMPASLPSVDAAIARDHSNSIVVDLPYGLRGGVNVTGQAMPPPALVLATADGHPRAGSYTSWVPQTTYLGINRIAFYGALLQAQNGIHFTHNGPVMMRVRRSVGRINIGWVVVWHPSSNSPKGARALKGLGERKGVTKFLYSAGFRPRYQVKNSWGNITVWKRMS